MAPVALMVMSPPFGDFHKVAIGGVHLGDRVEGIKEICKKRGYGQENGYNRVSWSKDWNLVWEEVHGKVIILTFTNERMMKNVGAQGDTNRPDLVNIRKGDAK